MEDTLSHPKNDRDVTEHAKKTHPLCVNPVVLVELTNCGRDSKSLPADVTVVLKVRRSIDQQDIAKWLQGLSDIHSTKVNYKFGMVLFRE